MKETLNGQSEVGLIKENKYLCFVFVKKHVFSSSGIERAESDL